MDEKVQFVIVIPSLNPNEALPSYIKDLRTHTDLPILLIDDGSKENCKKIFTECKTANTGVTVKTHIKNRGKGRALKTAFSYLLKEYPNLTGCITADSDGQHLVKDVLAAVTALKENPEALVLGCRQFGLENVPWRSRFGNESMRKLFKLVTKREFLDTQTGLRAIPASFMHELLKCPGERFEFETHMLLRLKDRMLVQVPIDTVYLNNNSESHFSPLKDSVKIITILLGSGIFRFISFLIVSLMSFFVEMAVFVPSYEFLFKDQVVTSNFFARIVSLIFSYLCNRFYVFKNRKKQMENGSLLKFLALAGVLFAASTALIKFAVEFIPDAEEHIALTKTIAEGSLFFISYLAQKYIVFREKKSK